MNSNEKKNDSNFTYDMQDAYTTMMQRAPSKKERTKKNLTLPGRDRHGSGNGGGAAFLSLLAAIAGVCAPHLLSASF